jgi:hypothetical protein
MKTCEKKRGAAGQETHDRETPRCEGRSEEVRKLQVLPSTSRRCPIHDQPQQFVPIHDQLQDK